MQPDWSRIRAFGWLVLLVSALFLAAVSLVFAVAAMLDPTRSILTDAGSGVWPIFGPHLFLLDIAALAVGLAGARRWSRFGPLVAVIGGIAIVASAVILASILAAFGAAGGSANPLTGLVLGDMTARAPDATETYTTTDGKPLNALIYRPTGSGPAPTMLYIHGGGWIGGSAGRNAHDHGWFADRGWLVVSVDYRVATATYPTWDRAPRDVACALAWIGRNAARLGGDPRRIVVLGDSAGGNLAVNLAYGAALGTAESGCGGDVPVPVAVIASYPVVDPQDAYDHGLPLPGVEPRTFTSWYIGGTPAEHPDRMRAISSATYLSAGAPPTLIVEPEKDGLIPTPGILRFAEQARAAGVDVTVARIPFANHGFDQAAANSIGNQGRLSIVERYLRDRGLAPGD